MLDVVADIQWPDEIQCIGDGRCFVASVHDPDDEERSAIWIVTPDKSKQRIYRGPSYVPSLIGEKGLTGMALHPRFTEDDRIFFFLRDTGGEHGQSLWNAWQAALAAGNGRPTVIVTSARSVSAAPNH